MLYNNGVDAVTAAKWLGHADINTTLEIYTHLSQQKERREMAQLDLAVKADLEARLFQLSASPRKVAEKLPNP